jgi:Flp pilus assembly protein TadB
MGGIVYLEEEAGQVAEASGASAVAEQAPAQEIAGTGALSKQEKLARLRAQVAQVSRELEELEQTRDFAGLKGKQAGVALFVLCGIGAAVAAVVAQVSDVSSLWMGILGMSVVIGAVGIIFYGDGKRTLSEARERHQQRLQELAELKQAGEAEIERLS